MQYVPEAFSDFSLPDDLTVGQESQFYFEEEDKDQTNSQDIRQALAKRIQQITRSPEKFSAMKDSEIKPKIEQADYSTSLKGSTTSKIRKKRTYITVELLDKIRPVFERYRQQRAKKITPQQAQTQQQQRLTVKSISSMFYLSQKQVRYLYEEFNKDPLFIARRTKAQNLARNKGGPVNRFGSPINCQRMDYIRQLLSEEPTLNASQIHQRISQLDRLHRSDLHGNLVPLSLKNVTVLMRKVKESQKVKDITSIDSPQLIQHRFEYARRYLQAVSQQQADVCFLGEFSFVNGYSLSSCPADKRQTFVVRDQRGGQQLKDSAASQWSSASQPIQNRDIQYIAAVSISGVVHYEIFSNIFQELNFENTVNAIGRVMCSRNTAQKKQYLILESSPLHKKEPLLQLQKVFHIKVLFIPPMTPMLSPCQYLFNDVKTMTRSHINKQKQGRNLKLALTDIMDSMNVKNMEHYFKCAQPYLQRALKQAPFK